jgi:hypothetical protein
VIADAPIEGDDWWHGICGWNNKDNPFNGIPISCIICYRIHEGIDTRRSRADRSSNHFYLVGNIAIDIINCRVSWLVKWIARYNGKLVVTQNTDNRDLFFILS